MAGVHACVVGRRDNETLEIARWAFDILHADKVASVETYEHMMSLYSKYTDARAASQLRGDFLQQGYTYTSYFLSTYIALSAKHCSDEEMADCVDLYSTLQVRYIQET